MRSKIGPGGVLKGVQPCGLSCPEVCGSPPSVGKVLRSWALSSQQPLQVLGITDECVLNYTKLLPGLTSTNYT